MMKQLICGVAGLLILLAAVPALAHDGGVTGYAVITVDRHMVRYKLTLSSIPAGPLATQMGIGNKTAAPKYKLLAEAIAKLLRLTNNDVACHAGPRQTMPPTQAVVSMTAQVDFVCPGRVRKLTIRDDLFDVLGNDIHTLARIDLPGSSQQFAFRSEARQTTIIVAGGSGSTSAGGAGSFFPLGIAHILTGYDHLLFLLALIICGGGLVQMLKIVTGFTVGHSITLALATLNIIMLPSYLVEALIALSISYVAAENLYPRFAVSRRWAISFVFGAVHGLGFSAVLREAGLSGSNLLWSLLSFNLGVEAGQAAVVLIALPMLVWLRSSDWEPMVTKTISSAILIFGLGLFTLRIFGL